MGREGEVNSPRKLKSRKQMPKSVVVVAVSGMHGSEQQWAVGVVRALGGKVMKGHMWDSRTSHVVFGSSSSRGEKFMAAAAAGAHMLDSTFLKASEEAGEWVDESLHIWDGGRGVGAGLIDPGTVQHWRNWHQEASKTSEHTTGIFSGLKVALYGNFDTKPALSRVIPAGGGQVVCQAPPYTKAIQQGLSCAVVQPDKAASSKWVAELAAAAVPCVHPEMFVDLLARPQSHNLTSYLLFDSLSFGPSLSRTIARVRSFTCAPPAKQVKQAEETKQSSRRGRRRAPELKSETPIHSAQLTSSPAPSLSADVSPTKLSVPKVGDTSANSGKSKGSKRKAEKKCVSFSWLDETPLPEVDKSTPARAAFSRKAAKTKK
eukprot:CAMPEP_0196577520 /NCGR_PEP_ID=MMETSP1081-20130531/6578_1 /TAXON_ID=36882 /ORGANISM="Pyramimonas amylifera, Strain CCMP720" /LENGTH=373 /DNA_ID=CAMNT_0041896471 /DNA_START=295 /DNA_END=1416 /DNA_ORIENTATION=+